MIATKERYGYIDIAKGIGIICVVFGHLEILKHYVYMFHMPLFFFISGFLLKGVTFNNVFIKNKILHLLLPYLTYMLLIYPLYVFDYFSDNKLNAHSILIIIINFILGRGGVYTVAFWFIRCLFLVQLILGYLMENYSSQKVRLVMIISLIIAYLNNAFFQSIFIPWNINIVLMAAPIYYLGYLFNRIGFTFTINLISISVSIIGMLLVLLGYNNYFDMLNTFYGIPIVTLISAIGTTVTMLILSKVIFKLPILSKLLSEIGKSSLVIMFLHQAIHLLLFKYITNNVLIVFCLCIALPYIAYIFFSRYALTRILFLGSAKEISLVSNSYKKSLT